MIFYVTFGEQPSGIFRSQVEDTVSFLAMTQSDSIRLVAFVSFRGYLHTRKIIRENTPSAIVLPMYPRVKNWAKNKYLLKLLCLLYKPKMIFGRSVLATILALNAKHNGLTSAVIYDGRGAISAEWNEYDVINDEQLKKDIFSLEKRAVLESDRRIAVSNKLLEHWTETFLCKIQNVQIIPCTLDHAYLNLDLNSNRVKSIRQAMNISDTDILLIYSGSIAGWQSMNLLMNNLEQLLLNQQNLKLLFLTRSNTEIDAFMAKFPERVKNKFLKPEEVSDYLLAGDYGLLIREKSITNKVASPVKFAEYLACGLKVIISEEIGDYSEMVEKEDLGYLFNSLPKIISTVPYLQKQILRNYALKKFSKEYYKSEYLNLCAI